MRSIRWSFNSIGAALIGISLASALQAQTTVHSFETGLEGWSYAGGPGGALAASTIGATDGTGSLQATVQYAPNDPVNTGFHYIQDGFNKLAELNVLLPAGNSISFDITLDGNSDPTNTATFLQTRMAINDDGGFQESNATQPDIEIPLAPGTYTATFDLDFWTEPAMPTYRGLAIALNVDAPMIVYIDNVRVNQVPEPATIALFGMGLVGVSAGLMRRRR